MNPNQNLFCVPASVEVSARPGQFSLSSLLDELFGGTPVTTPRTYTAGLDDPFANGWNAAMRHMRGNPPTPVAYERDFQRSGYRCVLGRRHQDGGEVSAGRRVQCGDWPDHGHAQKVHGQRQHLQSCHQRVAEAHRPVQAVCYPCSVGS